MSPATTRQGFPSGPPPPCYYLTSPLLLSRSPCFPEPSPAAISSFAPPWKPLLAQIAAWAIGLDDSCGGAGVEGGGCGAVVDFEVGPGWFPSWAGSWVEGRAAPQANLGFARGTGQVQRGEDMGSALPQIASAASWGR